MQQTKKQKVADGKELAYFRKQNVRNICDWERSLKTPMPLGGLNPNYELATSENCHTLLVSVPFGSVGDIVELEIDEVRVAVIAAYVCVGRRQ